MQGSLRPHIPAPGVAPGHQPTNQPETYRPGNASSRQEAFVHQQPATALPFVFRISKMSSNSLLMTQARPLLEPVDCRGKPPTSRGMASSLLIAVLAGGAVGIGLSTLLVPHLATELHSPTSTASMRPTQTTVSNGATWQGRASILPQSSNVQQPEPVIARGQNRYVDEQQAMPTIADFPQVLRMIGLLSARRGETAVFFVQVSDGTSVAGRVAISKEAVH